MNRLAAIALNWIEHRPGWVITVFGACAVAALTLLDYRVGHSYADWIDRSDPSYQDYQAMVAAFDDADTIQAAFPRRALTADNVEGYFALMSRLRAMDGVLNVFEPAELFLGADELTPPGDAAAAEFRVQRARRQPDYRNVLIAQDAETLGPLILVDPARKPAGADVLRAVTDGFAALAIEPALAGTVVFAETLKAAIGADLGLVVMLLLTTSLLLLLVFFRDPVLILSVLLGVVLSTLYSFAITSAVGLTINLLTLLLVPLVFCVSLTTAVHLLARRGDGVWRLRDVYPGVLVPLTIATVTSALGCLAFANAPQSIVARMGIVMPAAVVFTFLTMMLCVPALLALGGRLVRTTARGARRGPWIPAQRTRRAVSIVLMVCCVLAAWRLPDLRREPDAFRFFPENAALVRAYRYVEAHLSGLLVVDLVIRATDGGPVTSGGHQATIERFLADLRTLPGLTTIVSGYDLLRLPGGQDALPAELGTAFFTHDRRATRISLRLRNADARPYAESLQDIGRRWDARAPAALSLSVTGIIPLILEAQDRLLKTQGATLIAGLGLVCVLLVPFFRSARLFTYSLIAIFVPLIITAGAMAWLGIPLNSINLFVGSVILGLVVDDAIYLLHAYQLHGSIAHALAEVGDALSITSLVIGLAFLTLTMTHLVPIRQFGGLSVIAVAAAWACDMCLLPTLIERKPA